MMKIIIAAILFLSAALWAEIFEFKFNTDVKSKYEFGVRQNSANYKMSEDLKKFQDGDALSVSNFDLYLEAADENTTAPIEEDVMVDFALKDLQDFNVTQEEVIELKPEDTNETQEEVISDDINTSEAETASVLQNNDTNQTTPKQGEEL